MRTSKLNAGWSAHEKTSNFRSLPVSLSSIYAVLLGLLFILLIIFGFRSAFPDGHNLWDFGSFFLSGYSAARGVDPYSSIYLSEVQARYNITFTFPNLNPPFVVSLCELISFIHPVGVFYGWVCLSLIILTVELVVLIRKWPQSRKVLGVLWALSFAPLWETLALGQIYVPLLLVVTSAYWFLRRSRWLMAGLMVGLLVVIKPNFLFLPMLFLFAGYGQVAYTTIAAAALLMAIPIIKFGPVIYQQWLAVCLSLGNLQSSTCLSPVTFLGQALLGSLEAQYVLAISACGFSVWLGIKRKLSPQSVMDLGLVTTLFITPVSWVGYALLLLPAFFSRKLDWLLISGGLLLCAPANLIWEFSLSSHPWARMIGIIYPTAWVLFSARVVKDCLDGDRLLAGTAWRSGTGALPPSR